MAHDLIIRNGTIVDGTGVAGYPQAQCAVLVECVPEEGRLESAFREAVQR